MPSISFTNFSGESVEIDLTEKTPADALAIGSRHLDDGLKKRHQKNKYIEKMIFQVELMRDNAVIETGQEYTGDFCNIEKQIEEVENDLEKFYKLFFDVMADLSGLSDSEIKAIYPPIKN